VATVGKNLSTYDSESIPNGADFKIGIVVSEWNDQITNNLCEGARLALIENGVEEDNILIHQTPGSFELPLSAQWMLHRDDIDGVVAIGSVIQGETKHFDFVCQATAQGIKDVGLKYDKPAIFCVLTDNTMQQAIDRSGGRHGNKGIEAAVACLKMIQLKRNLK
jgi:6,7-dimethyl-8-ribityllumazine synthase